MFESWALSNGFKAGLTIVRKDNEKGYNPKNCCWITHRDQAKNRRSNHKIIYELQNVFNLLPNMKVDELVKSFASKCNDQHLLVYMSSLVRTVIALNDLVDNQLHLKKLEKEGRLKKNGDSEKDEDDKEGEDKDKDKEGEGEGKKETEKKDEDKKKSEDKK